MDDIAQRLARFPAEDIEGLWAVGLVPSTRKNDTANARYNFGERPVIRIYSHTDALEFKLPPHTKQIDIEWGLCMELEYGMRVERQGSRFLCRWSAADLRLFIVGHVLAHEVGYHVYCRRRHQQGYAYCPNKREAEQFAEAYAARPASACRPTRATSGLRSPPMSAGSARTRPATAARPCAGAFADMHFLTC